MAKKKKPTLNYAVYLLTIFALLVIIIIGFKGTQLNNYCPKKKVPCQVFLSKGEKSPYRKNIHAAYSGWHFAGFADIKSCWVGYPSFCGFCSDLYEDRAFVCRKKYPKNRSKPSR